MARSAPARALRRKRLPAPRRWRVVAHLPEFGGRAWYKLIEVSPSAIMRDRITERLARLSALGAPDAAAGLREAAVLVPLIEHPGGMTILLAQRTQHLHHHPGQIG